jgi:hypothetical protein
MLAEFSNHTEAWEFMCECEKVGILAGFPFVSTPGQFVKTRRQRRRPVIYLVRYQPKIGAT